MSEAVSNPLNGPPPSFEPPNADVEISAEARAFAQAPMYAGPGQNREPTDAEQVARLVTARDVLGEKFWQPKSAPPPTAAEKAEADRLQLIGVQPGAQAEGYAIQLPPGTHADTGDRIRAAMAALELTKAHGENIAQFVVATGQHIGSLSEGERSIWEGQQSRTIEQYAANKGWNLPEVKANVERMMSDRKVDGSVAALAMANATSFLWLAHHAENLRTIKR